MSALIFIRNKQGKLIQARALLDTCSTAHFITEDLARKLHLPRQKDTISIQAMNNMCTSTQGSIEIVIKSRLNDFEKTLTCLIVPKIADPLPAETFPRELISIPSNLRLADPQFHLPRPVNLLIGAGTTLSLLSVGQVNLSKPGCDLYLQKTRLGWVIAGGCNEQAQPSAACHLTDLKLQLARFWELEEVDRVTKREQEDLECERHYQQHTRRDRSGKYVVRLPFKQPSIELGESYLPALRRFQSLQKTLRNNPQLKDDYSQVMQEYLDLGHMSLVTGGGERGCYLPHHAVVKESSTTTKVRVVFDASAKTSTGASLNDALMIGPTIQPKLFEHLLKFRNHRYVLIADIEKMYRQILVDPSDRKYQQILWEHEGKLKTFQLNTVTFGVSAAPFLAIRTLQQLAEDEKSRFPLASRILREDFYVDDLTSGADSVEQLNRIKREVTDSLASGGFTITKWASNHLNSSDEGVQRDFNVKGDSVIRKTLGVVWDSESDCFMFTVAPPLSHNLVTKRVILSEIAKIFDPLGLLGPVVLALKVIIQSCWKDKLGWDESVSQEIYSRWFLSSGQFNCLRDLRVPRFLLLPDAVEIEIHGFCDASKIGYGAALYVRSVNSNGEILVRLACAKTRVAPVKPVTIPRLELCGAVLLVKLFEESKARFTFHVNNIIFWSDSEIVLHWIRKDPQNLQVFEGNRVAEIQRLSRDIEWRHVRGKDNPADILSRGQTPSEFVESSTWFEGLPWLRQPSTSWPNSNLTPMSELPGLRKDTCLLTHVTEQSEPPFYQRFSSFFKLINVVVYCLRFGRPGRSDTGPIRVEERREAERRILRLIQHEQFKREIDQIKREETVKSGRLANLSPFVDDNGLLRVGGRLRNANIPYSAKYPILLPSRHHVTDMLIRSTHISLLHAGRQSTLNCLRQRYWLLDGKNQIGKIIRRCNTCIRNRPVVAQGKMADLPTARVSQAFAFDRVGVDFLGPISIKEKKFKNRVVLKAYGCVFICMVTKAVHIEIVSDLTTEGFLASFKRFIGRRGIPSKVFSDNGTNFVGANNQLKELYQLVESSEFKEKVTSYALSQAIEWHFNPPLSPHFGGIWEAAVKSFKHHYNRVTGGKMLTFEQLNTLTIQIEAILNSRPLGTVSSDPNDPTTLTPAHFLIGRPLVALPDPDLTSVPENRLTVWRFVTQACQHFWKRWHIEYLHELQKRQKWLESKGEIKVGTVVLVIEKTAPCSEWLLGVVIEVCPGSDGVIRVVKIKTARGEYTRNITSLCPLPHINQDI